MNIASSPSKGASPPAPEPYVTGQIQNWIENLRTVVEDSCRLSAEFENKTIPVVRPENQVTDNAKDPPLEALVPIADQIRDITRTIEFNNNRLRSLLGRIEL